MEDNNQFKNSSQYKYYRHKLLFHLICAFAFLIINIFVSILLMISSNISDNRLNKFFVVWIIVCFCLVIVYYLPILIYFLIKIKQIVSDTYKERMATVIKINEISYSKSEFHLSFEKSSELYDVVAYKKFLDEKQYRIGSKINVLQGDKNILL